MRIEIHPKPDGMQHINLMFCEEKPDPEDIWIHDRILEFPVPPKRTLQWERDGQQYTVLQFGQCVIGHVMFDIEKHKGIVDKIREACGDDIEQLAAAHSQNLEEDVILRLISETALEFHKKAKFTVNASGDLGIDLDAQQVREYLQQRVQEEVSEQQTAE